MTTKFDLFNLPEICILEIRSTQTHIQQQKQALVDIMSKKSMLSRSRLNTLRSHLLV